MPDFIPEFLDFLSNVFFGGLGHRLSFSSAQARLGVSLHRECVKSPWGL
jgi:hypothetical protein